MKIICTTKPLIDAVALVGRNVRAKPPSDVLKCVKISAPAGGPLRIESHSGSAWASAEISAVDVQSPGELCVNADTFERMIGNCADDATITLSEESDRMVVAGDRTRSLLWTLAAKDFPSPLDIADNAASVTANAKELVMEIGRITPCIAKDTSQYAMKAVHFKCDKKLILAATDGNRLHESRTGFRCDTKASANIPPEPLSLFVHAAGSCDGDATLRIGVDSAEFAVPGFTVRTACVEGAFPPYEDVIPKPCGNAVECGKDDLLAACKIAASVVSVDGTSGIRWIVDNNELRLSRRAVETGEVNTRLDAKSFGDFPKEIGVRPRYMADAVQGTESASVRFECEKEGKPLVYRNGGFTAVVMPVALSSLG